MNYYLILGIATNASQDEIKEAYRKLAQKYHPDHYGDDSTPFLRIQEAYRVLTDKHRKENYDRKISYEKRRSPLYKRYQPGISPIEPEPLVPTTESSPVEEISLSRSFHSYFPSFEELFDRIMINFSQKRHAKSEHPENLSVEVTVSAEQAETGGSINLMIPTRIPCPLCSGSRTIGFWDCMRCESIGYIDTEIPLVVSYPSGIKNNYSRIISLQEYGIENLYLTLKISVSKV
jgi:DnaJ-class molecular chaperone